MGLLDGLIGNVMGSMLSGNQAQNPLDAVLGGLGGRNQAQGGNMLLQLALSMLQQIDPSYLPTNNRIPANTARIPVA